MLTVEQLYAVMRKHMEMGRHKLPVIIVDYKTGFAMPSETAYDVVHETLFESSASAFLEPNDEYIVIYADRKNIE